MTERGSRYIDFLLPGLLGMNLAFILQALDHFGCFMQVFCDIWSALG